ncbi:MAG TPA: phospho-N-acetylmuramoyl-pentapeptide-transferase [Anaerolineales bacterium]|nr:phospho-N-acetylmuramoyl-pentapeptide-transferase [Anaerolineales bacterium]
MTQSSIALALAGITFLLTVIWGSPFIRVLKRLRVVAADGPATEFESFTMGGLLFIAPVALLTLLLNFAAATGLTGVGLSILLPLAALLIFAGLGGWIDFRRLRGRTHRGVLDRFSLTGQLALAVPIAYGLWAVLDVPEMYFPFYRGELALGLWYIPVAALLIAGIANAFQVTTGVDGLPGMLGATAFAAYGAIALQQEQIFVARFCFTVVGALLGFLWFNIRPAVLYMGRLGTYAMGAGLAVVAMMTGQWPLLALIAVIPLVELASIGLQRFAARISPGRQVLRSTPLHEHFLAGRWSPTQIVQRFWLINLLFAAIGITLALV